MDMRSTISSNRSSSLERRGAQKDPFTLMRREMERLFDSFSQDWPTPLAAGLSSPKVDIAETDAGPEITAELPGIDQKDVRLDLADGILTLAAEDEDEDEDEGEGEKEEKDEKKHYHLVERSRGSLIRRFAIPFEPDADNVQAHFDKGVLHITVPRFQKAARQVKKIAINGG